MADVGILARAPGDRVGQAEARHRGENLGPEPAPAPAEGLLGLAPGPVGFFFRDGCPVPIAGVVSDGQHSIRKAVARVFPDVPYQLCQFHYLREAARPIYEADRHAKKTLKKKVRTVRGIERRVEGRDDTAAEVVRGYCSAVRSALTDDGRPPLEASGLKLHDRLTAIAGSLDRVAEKGGSRPNSGS